MDKLVPVLTIHPFWQDVIRSPDGEIWIATREMDQNSAIDTLTTTLCDGRIKIVCPENYQFVSANPLCLVVKHIPTGLKVAFVAPSKCHIIHDYAVLSVSVAENALAVSSCEHDKLLVWDTRTNEVIQNLKGHGGPVYKCRYFPSGVVIISAGADGSCRIWSAETGINPVLLKGHTMAVNDICIIDKGRNVISVSRDGFAKLWDVGEAKCLDNILDELGPINCCAITTTTHTVEVDNEREIGTGNKLLIVGCESGQIVATHVGSRTLVFTQHLDSACNAITVVDNSIIAGGGNGKVVEINKVTGAIEKLWDESSSPVLTAAALPNQSVVIGRQDGACTVLSLQVAHKKVRVELTGSHYDAIRDVYFNGKWIFAGCRDGQIRKYDFNQINVHYK